MWRSPWLLRRCIDNDKGKLLNNAQNRVWKRAWGRRVISGCTPDAKSLVWRLHFCCKNPSQGFAHQCMQQPKDPEIALSSSVCNPRPPPPPKCKNYTLCPLNSPPPFPWKRDNTKDRQKSGIFLRTWSLISSISRSSNNCQLWQNKEGNETMRR